MNGALKVPPSRPYIISNDNKFLLTNVNKIAMQGESTNVLVTGKAGCGKSELVTQFAASNKRPLVVLEVGMLSEPSQIFGYRDLKDGQVSFVPGIFTVAIQTPMAVIHLEELNRPETDRSLNAIFSILDPNVRAIWIDELGDYIRIAPGVTIFASLNEGFEFVGTIPIDEALRNRFGVKIRLDYLPGDREIALLILRTGITEEMASQIVSIANSLRQNSQESFHLSVRDTINIAQWCKMGASLLLAFRTTLEVDESKLEQIFLSLHLAGIKLSHEEVMGYGLL